MRHSTPGTEVPAAPSRPVPTNALPSAGATRRDRVEAGLGGLDFDLVSAHPTGHGLDRDGADYALAYFYALDIQSHPSLMAGAGPGTAQRRDDVVHCSDVLLERLKHRHRALGEVPPRVPAESELARLESGPQQRLARLQRELLTRWFPGSFHGIDWARVLWAYERFASGRLGSGQFERTANTWPGQPDGMNIFMFAEFSLMTAATDGEPALWRRLAALFTLAEQLFSVAYGRSSRSRAEGHGDDLPLTWQTRGPPARPPAQAALIDNDGWRQWLRDSLLGPNVQPALVHAQILRRACPGGFGGR